MEQLDKQLQQRVWQRVTGREPAETPPQRRENWKPLVMAAQENLAAYRYLAQQLPRYREPLGHLARETRKCIARIRGICGLRGERVKLPLPEPVREPARRSLEKCYHRQQKMWQEMDSRTGDPEYGVVFTQLARQGADLCVALTELLGKLEES